MHVRVDDAGENVAALGVQCGVSRIGHARREPHDLPAHDADLDIEDAIGRDDAPATHHEIEPLGLVDRLGVMADNGAGSFHQECRWAIRAKKSTITRNATSRSAGDAYSSG